MKLLVLAQTPPPLHGQSLMVQTLVAGLPAHGISLHHVNLGLSRNAADIGHWRWGKLAAVLDACLHTIIARFTQGCDTLYYVPAPGKRGALYRDWLVMLLCRPFYPRLVLHWHAAGLGVWLMTHATAPERWLTQRLLGGADLSLVLADSLRADATALAAKKIAVVANGIADPGTPTARSIRTSESFQVLFLGLCSAEKGLFTTAAAVVSANKTAHHTPFTLVAAGEFPDDTTATRFRSLCAEHPTTLRHVGPVHGDEKILLLRTSHCLCLPTRYPAEGQPLVLLEAMAHDLPIIATRWGAIPDTVPPATPLVAPGDTHALTNALQQCRDQPPLSGRQREYFLSHYTTGQHLSALAETLRTHLADASLDPNDPTQHHRARWQGVWRNVGTSVIARIVAASCMLAQVPLALSHLGADGFGVWMAFAGFAGLLQIADLGLGVSAQNQLATAFGQGDLATFQFIRRRTFLRISGVALLVGAALTPVAWYGHWSQWLNLSNPTLAAQLPWAALIALAGFTLNLPLSFVGRIASAQQRSWLNPIGNTVASVGQLIAVVIAVQMHATLAVFVLIGQLGPVLQNLTGLLLNPGDRTAPPPGESPIPPAVSVAPWRDSFAFFLPQAAATTSTFILPILLSLFSGPLAVTQVNLLQRIFNLLTQIHLMVLGPLWPAYTEAHARRDHLWIRRSFVFSLKLTAVFVVGGLFTTWLMPWILASWVGEQNSMLPADVTALVALWMLAQLASQPFAFLLGGLNHPRGMAIYGTASQVLTIAASCWLGTQYGTIGIVGAAAVIAVGLNLPATAIEGWWRFQQINLPSAPDKPGEPALQLPPFIRAILARRLSGPDPRAPRHRLKACIFKVDRIGDFVLASSAIRRLLAGHGETNCLLVISTTVADLAAREFPRTPQLTVPPHATGLLREMAGIRRTTRAALGAYHFEQLICLRHQRSLYRDLLLTWIKADQWIGLSSAAPTRNTLSLVDDYAHSPRYPSTDGTGRSRDVIAHHLITTEALPTVIAPAECHPRLTGLTVTRGTEFLVLPFSSDPVRNYPAPLLAQALGHATIDGPLVLSGTTAQRPQLAQLAELTYAAGGRDVQIHTDDASPLALIDRVARARAVLSMDSAAAHLATALDKPAVIILGGGEWELMSPWGPRLRQRWVTNPLPCFNCSWRCQFERTLCLTEIPAAQVTQAINEVLALA